MEFWSLVYTHTHKTRFKSQLCNLLSVKSLTSNITSLSLIFLFCNLKFKKIYFLRLLGIIEKWMKYLDPLQKTINPNAYTNTSGLHRLWVTNPALSFTATLINCFLIRNLYPSEEEECCLEVHQHFPRNFHKMLPKSFKALSRKHNDLNLAHQCSVTLYHYE